MNGYDLYFGNVVFPVTPESINTQINGKNKVYDLINEGEMNILKLPGLTTVSFSVLLPSVQYPFAVYKNGFKQPSYYLDLLERLKVNKTPFQFIISRHENGNVRRNLHNTNMTASLESYVIRESAKDAGMDIIVDIELKQYREYKTKTFNVTTPSPTAPIALTPVRPVSTAATEDSGGGGGGGGGNKGKKYKVQIPGMSVVEVWATSVQGAITKACGSNWTGTIYVDGTSYYVKNGKISIKPSISKAAVNAIVAGATAVVGVVANAVNNKTKVTGKVSTVAKTATTGLKAGVKAIKLTK